MLKNKGSFFAISARVFFLAAIAIFFVMWVLASVDLIDSGPFYAIAKFMMPTGLLILCLTAYFFSLLSRLMFFGKNMIINIFAILAMIFIVLTTGAFLFLQEQNPLRILLSSGALFFGLPVYLFSLQYKKVRSWSVLAIFILFLPTLTFGIPTLNYIFSYLYSPDTINEETLPSYKNCINFLKDHPDILFHSGVTIELNENYYRSEPDEYAESLKGLSKEGFSEKQILEIEQILKSLQDIDCYRAFRKEGMIVFVYQKNFIMPAKAGVVYSLDGTSPNESDENVFKDNQPFNKIYGSWYVSKKLIEPPEFRLPIELSFSKNSLIDHSAKIYSVSKDDLTLGN